MELLLGSYQGYHFSQPTMTTRSERSSTTHNTFTRHTDVHEAHDTIMMQYAQKLVHDAASCGFC
jgi:hypothetical protein